MLERNPNSHKGENGKVMVVGGSTLFHGAPILCSLAAEHSGVDLVYPFLPPSQKEAAKYYSLNFILQTFQEEILSSKDAKAIVNFSKQVDCVVIGPGLGADSKTKTAVKTILANLKVPTVVDASALIYTNSLPEICILTPHQGEFKALTGDEPTPKNIQKWAKDLKATIVCKGPEDIIATADDIAINNTGNAMMTVGGTGDALAGLIGGLLAQGMEPFEAAKQGTRVLGLLAESYEGLEANIRAIDLVRNLPISLAKL